MSVQEVLSGERKWAIVQQEAIAFLESLPEGSLDLIVASPPYEKCRLYLESGENLGIARDTEEWVAWMVQVSHAARRACKGLVAWVVEGQTRDFRYTCSPDLLRADLCRDGFCLRKSPIFHRVGIPGSGGPDWLRNDYEPIVCFTRGGKLPWSDNVACGHAPKYAPGGAMSNRQADGGRVGQPKHKFMSMTSRGSDGERKVAGGRRVVRGIKDGDTQTSDSYDPPAIANPGNVITCKVGGGLLGHALAHENEAPFPLDLAAFFVKSFCPPDGIVADCFSGSGTTAHAAVAEGRCFVGCDLRESQVSLGHRRLTGVTPTMFP